jgi:hypothetical protein
MGQWVALEYLGRWRESCRFRLLSLSTEELDDRLEFKYAYLDFEMWEPAKEGMIIGTLEAEITYSSADQIMKITPRLFSGEEVVRLKQIEVEDLPMYLKNAQPALERLLRNPS